MKNKLLLIISLLFCTAFSSAATLKEIYDSEDYTNYTSRAIYYSNITQFVTKATWKNIYEIGLITNKLASKYSAIYAYNNNWDKNTIFEFLGNLDLEDKYFSVDTYFCKFYKVKNETLNYKFNITLNMVDTEKMLLLYKKLIANGQFVKASYALNNLYNASNFTTSYSEWTTTEWIELCKSTFTEEVMSKLPYFRQIAVVNFWRHEDFLRKDANQTLSAKVYKYFDKASYIKAFPHSNNLYYNLGMKYPVDRDYIEFYALNVPLLEKAINSSIKVVDKYYNNKNSSQKLYARVLSFGTWKQARDLAVYLNDKDKIIDVYSKIDTNQSADDISYFIVLANGIDVDYRADDIKKILRNINAKYTLKLYDDRDTWEPILSKVRALIEAR